MNERENGQMELITPAELSLQGSVEDKLAKEIRHDFERFDERAFEQESTVIQRIDSLVKTEVQELFEGAGLALNGHAERTQDVLDRLHGIMATADSMNKQRSSISAKKFSNRRFKNETVEDMQDRAYLANVSSRRAGGAKMAMKGFPEEETAAARATEAQKGREIAIQRVVARRVYRDFGSTIDGLINQLGQQINGTSQAA